MSIQQNSMSLFRAAFIVAAAWALLQVVDTWLRSHEQKAIEEDTTALIEYLTANIQHASTIEYRIRDDPDREQHFDTFRDEIQGWRTRLGNELEQRLPNTGASHILLAALGELEMGRLGWERSQLINCQAALISILSMSDAFVRRSRTRSRAEHSGPHPEVTMPERDALLVQLKELNERSRTYARQFWQVSFAYLVGSGAVLTQLADEQNPLTLTGALLAIAVLGGFMVYHLRGLLKAARRSFDGIAHVEELLGLRKEDTAWTPGHLNALLWSTALAAAASFIGALYQLLRLVGILR
jgi:hypothetical protein